MLTLRYFHHIFLHYIQKVSFYVQNFSGEHHNQTFSCCRVATKIFEDFGGALNKAFIRGQEPVSSVHYTRPGTCINRPLH